MSSSAHPLSVFVVYSSYILMLTHFLQYNSGYCAYYIAKSAVLLYIVYKHKMQ